MLTVFLIAWPLISVIAVILFGRNNAKYTALGSALLQLGITVYAVCNFNPSLGIQFEHNVPWISSLGIHFHVGMDGISMLMVILTNLLTPLILLSSFRQEFFRPVLFYSLVLVMQSALVGVFVAYDAFLYYIFWEMALIPIYFIALLYGSGERVRITFKFFIYTLAGSLFMLLAFIYLYFQAGNSFEWSAFTNLELASEVQGWLFWAFFVAFAIKIPIFPFHTWQPDTYTSAPTPGTMLLSGIMLKMGLYSLIRWLLPVVPLAVFEWGKVAIVLAVIGIVYASWIAITRKDMKRLFAYSSIAHVGLIAAGILSLSLQGLQGGLIQMLSHGINVVGLFFVAQIIWSRLQTNDIASLGGIIHKAPKLAVAFLIILLGSVALPLTNGFVGEFLLLYGVFEYNIWLAVFAGLTIIFGAVYMLRTYQFSILGPVKEDMIFEDLNLSEGIVLGVICVLVILIGVYPEPILKLTEPAVKTLLETHYPLTILPN